MQGGAISRFIMTAARGLAINCYHIRFAWQSCAHPRRKGVGEKRWIDAVHQDCEPAFARNTILVWEILPQCLQMGFAPTRNIFIVVAAADRATNDKQ